MKVEICDLYRNGNTVYYWTLWDGPDGADKVSGYATTLEEVVHKILTWRQKIANDYCDSIPEVSGEGLGGWPTERPEHSDPGCGDDGDPEPRSEH